MPAPANDNFASALSIPGASGSTTGSNTGAGIEAGEPGHYNYNPGPAYPVARTLVGPYRTVWYKWVAPAAGYFYFTTRDLTGDLATDFKSTLRVFTGAAVNSLAAVATVMDQGVGDGNGADHGASLAFLAASGTIYYLQIDGRGPVDGNFKLSWGPYRKTRLGDCANCGVDFNLTEQCVGSLQISDVTQDTVYNFGTFAARPGKWKVRYCGGAFEEPGRASAVVSGSLVWITNPPTRAGGSTWSAFCGVAYTAANSALVWDMQTSYNAGDVVVVSDNLLNLNFTVYGAFVFKANNPSTPKDPTTGSWIDGGPDYLSNYTQLFVPNHEYAPSGGTVWVGNPGPNGTEIYDMGGLPRAEAYHYSSATSTNYFPATDATNWSAWGLLVTPDNQVYQTQEEAIAANLCSETGYFDNVPGGVIGIAYHTGRLYYQAEAGNNHKLTKMAVPVNGSNNPAVELIYFPLTLATLANTHGFAINGSDMSWTMNFEIDNSAGVAWDGCLVELLNTGGISGASAGHTVTLAAGTHSNSGNFTCTANPASGLVTATLRITRNGVVVGTIDYPLYPIYAGSVISLNNAEISCSGFKYWKTSLKITCLWPPAMPPAWGDSAWTSGWTGCNSLPARNVTRIALSLVGGTPHLFFGNTCTVVGSISYDQACPATINPLSFGVLAAGGTTTSVTVQIVFGFQVGADITHSLPAYALPFTVPAA